MSDVWLGRFNRWAEKLFNAKGGNVVVDINHQVQSMLALDKGVDQRYLEGWNRFAVVAVQAAVAAQASRARIRNPVGSNVIIVLEQLAVFNSANDNTIVTWGATTTDLANLVTLTFTRMDPRGNPQPTAIVSVNAQASGGQPLLQRSIPTSAATGDFINNPNQEIPILPGQVLDVQNSVVNVTLQVNFMWRERALESSELT